MNYWPADIARRSFERWESEHFPIIPKRLKGVISSEYPHLRAMQMVDEEVEKDSQILLLIGTLRDI